MALLQANTRKAPVSHLTTEGKEGQLLAAKKERGFSLPLEGRPCGGAPSLLLFGVSISKERNSKAAHSRAGCGGHEAPGPGVEYITLGPGASQS